MLQIFTMVRLTAILLGIAALLFCALPVRGDGPPGMVFGDDPRAPVEVDKDLMCESCHALFDVWRKRIGSKTLTESLIYETFETPTPICDQKNLRVYKAIPPTMQKGCEGFLDKYGEGTLQASCFLGGLTAESKHLYVPTRITEKYFHLPLCKSCSGLVSLKVWVQGHYR